ncbi:MAG: tRNA-dihydrouridine synthase family protein [archaeon]
MVLKIGSLKLKNQLVLAPMVDVTDLPYRLLCRKCGAGLAYTEMVYIDAALHENAKTLKMMKTCEEDSPLGLQITGDRLEEFEEFVSREDLWKDYDLIDLNCGCPSLRVARKSGAGSFLMNDSEKIASFVRVLKKTGKPVTVKVRLGFGKINVLEVARAIEDVGADAITVHARLATEGGRDRAQWEWISKVKETVKIPVIGNGDIVDGASANEVLERCDGAMIARAAIGDPLIFSRVQNYLDGKVEGEIDLTKNLELFKEYLKLQREHYGDGVDFGKIKYVGGRFLKKMKGAARLREEFHALKRLKDIEVFVERLNNFI